MTFVDDGSGWSFGCYTTFEVRDDAQEVPENQVRDLLCEVNEDPEDITPTGYAYVVPPWVVVCAWYWDGDGTLVFRIHNSVDGYTRTVVNNDCKKDYNWEDV